MIDKKNTSGDPVAHTTAPSSTDPDKVDSVPRNIRALIDSLRQSPPFNQMDDRDLITLLEKSTVEYFPAETIILSPDDGVPSRFYIVKKGYIVGERVTSKNGDVHPTFDIGPGACFPIAALLGERPTRTVHKAMEDTFCITCDKAHFTQIVSTSRVFREFCLRGISGLLEQVNRNVQTQAQSHLGDEYSLETPLKDYLHREVISCPPNTSVRQAVKTMDDRGIGSMVIINPDRKPLGIFTLRDLRHLVANPKADLDAPISEVMNKDPVFLPSSATAFDAALVMAKHHFAHVLIADDKRLKGVVSERDLFSLQRVNLVHVARTLANAPSVESLAEMQADVARLIQTMIAHGASAEQINRILSLLNDYTTRQVIRLAAKKIPHPDVPFAWLTFGSAGRREQTLLTDQDNGLIFQVDDPAQADDIRQRFLPLARHINEDLDRCGFTLCKGNIMAGNPKLCLSTTEWNQWFNQFIDSATPQNVLNSCIFFDLRTQWGPEELADNMFEGVRQRIQQNSIFQKMLAGAALENRPPLGIFKGFVTRKENGREGVDLKTQGLTPFVDAARVLCLAHGLTPTNTLHRLRELVQTNVVEEKDAGAWEEAYSFIQLLRLRQHLGQKKEGNELSNLVDPDELNHLDERILKEAFRQAQRLQRKLAWNFQL
ncbi:putative nucleotidyltransferase substrate binding domain-containing protein [Hahella ganghwensis]|uniref:putative nucleotidyltransferase substrate binding domain-containing protein n=1 Tax=Hahella ganghwensis TaxID=286420 RepID=UPI00037688D8|nr:putative nucleotidyltransferase substrate binding domain-containing protein [Hahella ganghwensis]